MSSPENRDMESNDWLGRFFGRGSSRRSGGFFGFPDVFRGFDEMRREIERGFENAFKNIQAQAPNDLVKEYQTPGGGKVREYGPFT